MTDRLTIVRPGVASPRIEPGEAVLSFEELRRAIRRGSLLARVGRYREGRLLVHRLESVGRPLPAALILRLLSRGSVVIEDAIGRRRVLPAAQLVRWGAQLACEPFQVSRLLARVGRDVEALGSSPATAVPPLDLARPPLYLRTDLSFGVRAGGSVGHIAGVVNTLDAFTGPPIFLTTDAIATLRRDIEVHAIEPAEAFWNFRELPTFVLNDAVVAGVAAHVGSRSLSFVYQRYSLNSYAGIVAARRFRVPLILEYNGSEIWMSRHWGRPLKYEALSRRIEQLNLTLPDVIVVVSRAMGDEVIGRGADPAAVLVNPNGVDPDAFNADVDASGVRQQYALGDATVVGFIGTFGPWHGAEVLARAFVDLHRRAGSAARVRLLMIGDGASLPQVRRILSDGGALEATVFTGLVPQQDGPAHLAACDILASPHVPNPDGSPFFGSPTKLFEYMAMGRAIVASNLDQIGDVLEHGRTAWMVPPGDATALADGLERLVDDPDLRMTLGAAAREQVLARYTWRQHTRRTIDRLRERVETSGAVPR
ncbi:MAG: glycosyl transferase group 1 [Acidobacteria bacterium]|nr:glycosyl transferase group 1 [Acidobacteriota bacterium]